jgi:hypothetical protein
MQMTAIVRKNYDFKTIYEQWSKDTAPLFQMFHDTPDDEKHSVPLPPQLSKPIGPEFSIEISSGPIPKHIEKNIIIKDGKRFIDCGACYQFNKNKEFIRVAIYTYGAGWFTSAFEGDDVWENISKND